VKSFLFFFSLPFFFFFFFFTKPSQIDKVKITPQHGITYEVENKIGSFATLDASGTGANQVVLGNITFGTHQSQDHTIQFAGSVYGEDAGQSSYFSVLGLPTSGTGQFLGITGRLSAAGVFERFNTTGIDAIGTLHFTLYGETP
jgi:hypothetical protein